MHDAVIKILFVQGFFLAIICIWSHYCKTESVNVIVRDFCHLFRVNLLRIKTNHEKCCGDPFQTSDSPD